MNNRRAFYRHPYHYPVKITEEENSISSQCVDVSLGGICIDYENKFLQGQSVSIEIPLSDHVFKLKGKVCYSCKKGSDSHYRIGIAFEDKSSVFKAKMAEEILAIQKLQKRMSLKEKKPIDEAVVAEAWIQRHAKRFSDYFS